MFCSTTISVLPPINRRCSTSSRRTRISRRWLSTGAASCTLRRGCAFLPPLMKVPLPSLAQQPNQHKEAEQGQQTHHAITYRNRQFRADKSCNPFGHWAHLQIVSGTGSILFFLWTSDKQRAYRVYVGIPHNCQANCQLGWMRAVLMAYECGSKIPLLIRKMRAFPHGFRQSDRKSARAGD